MNEQNLYPGWMREFQRYLPIKTQIYLYGNIYDRILYPVKLPESETRKWNYFGLKDFLYHFLRERGYQLIGFYDQVDGLTFMTNEEMQLFQRLSKGKEVSKPTAQPQTQTQIAQPTQPSQQSSSALTTPYLVDPDKALDAIRPVVAYRKIPVVFNFLAASRFTSVPNQLHPKEQNVFLKLSKCTQESPEISLGNKSLYNMIVLVCDKLNDLPSWLYLNNPLTKSIQIDRPNDDERRHYMNIYFRNFHEAENHQDKQKQYIEEFVDLTAGMRNYELEGLRILSTSEKISVSRIKDIIERYKFGVTESAWDKVDKSKLENATEELKQRVKGQDAAIQATVDIIKRAKMGLSGVQHSRSSNKPRGILFFAGPTGVGKTELAKALAQLLFRDEKACIRFDMSEYMHEADDQKLLGAPPGYVGYEEGGQLTNKVRENPFCVLLFDEIEKAHPRILDKFLQILEDGRMTDGKGETTYFSESIIIFTSNIGTFVDDKSGRTKVKNVNPEMKYEELRDKFMQAIKDHFNLELGRPEILRRFGNNFVIFDYVRPPVMKEIIDKILTNVNKEVADKHQATVIFSPAVYDFIFDRAKGNIEQGGGGVGNVIETVLINPLARKLWEMQPITGKKLEVKKVFEKDRESSGIFEVELS